MQWAKGRKQAENRLTIYYRSAKSINCTFDLFFNDSVLPFWHFYMFEVLLPHLELFEVLLPEADGSVGAHLDTFLPSRQRQEKSRAARGPKGEFHLKNINKHCRYVDLEKVGEKMDKKWTLPKSTQHLRGKSLSQNKGSPQTCLCMQWPNLIGWASAFEYQLSFVDVISSKISKQVKHLFRTNLQKENSFPTFFSENEDLRAAIFTPQTPGPRK